MNRPVEIMVASKLVSKFTQIVKSSGIKHHRLVHDVQKFVNSEHRRRKRDATFRLNKYHTLEEIYNWFDSLVQKHGKKRVRIIDLGRTHENRPIKGVKLTGDGGEKKKGIFIEGGIHAREWISPATVIYIIDRLLESMDTDIKNLAETYNWYLFPVLNPDGYVYTHTVVNGDTSFF